MNIRTPAEVFSPGEFIRDELEARGWTQDELAQIIGRPQTSINLIVKDKRGVTPETAILLSGAFGTSPEILAQPRFWLQTVQGFIVYFCGRNSATSRTF